MREVLACHDGVQDAESVGDTGLEPDALLEFALSITAEQTVKILLFHHLLEGGALQRVCLGRCLDKLHNEPSLLLYVDSLVVAGVHLFNHGVKDVVLVESSLDKLCDEGDRINLVESLEVVAKTTDEVVVRLVIHPLLADEHLEELKELIAAHG